MKITKKILGQLEGAYATSIMEVDGVTNYIIATERQGPCFAFNSENGEKKTVWDGPGGTMNIVPVQGRENEFFATQQFLPTFQAKECILVHGVYNNGEWTVTSVMNVPYLHRFDIFSLNNKLCFIGCTLAQDKESKEDWSKPGKVYIGELSEDLNKPFEIKPIIEGITKNHGFSRGTWKGKDAYFASGVEGVYVIYLPSDGSIEFKTEHIIDHEVSDMAAYDLDGDGIEELAVIQPFHGNKGIIYKNIDGKLVQIYEHEYEFGHVVWGGKIMKKPAFIIGGRKGSRELICYQLEQGEIKEFLIDNTGGPSNIAVINTEKADIVLAANREIGEMALYEITE